MLSVRWISSGELCRRMIHSFVHVLKEVSENAGHGADLSVIFRRHGHCAMAKLSVYFVFG